MMEDSQTKALTGIPGLAHDSDPEISFLAGYQHRPLRPDEIVFVLVPHIIRGPEMSPGSEDMLDVGTANAHLS